MIGVPLPVRVETVRVHRVTVEVDRLWRFLLVLLVRAYVDRGWRCDLDAPSWLACVLKRGIEIHII